MITFNVEKGGQDPICLKLIDYLHKQDERLRVEEPSRGDTVYQIRIDHDGGHYNPEPGSDQWHLVRRKYLETGVDEADEMEALT